MSIDTLPAGARIACDDWEVGDGFRVGDDVVIECRQARIGHNVKIGVRTDENFRWQSGVRIKVDELILGDGVVIDREVLLRGGCFQLERCVRIRGGGTLHVNKSLVLQPYGVVNESCEILGVDIKIGRYLWMLPHAKIGGGSAFEVHSKLRIGHFCHLGMYTFINTARLVELADEVGLGTETALYTHGAYPSVLQGFPVAFGEIHIGDRSWLPGATVNPSVTIGKDCVIGVGSVVTRDIPDGSLAAGVPARVLKENAYPDPLTGPKRFAFFLDFIKTFCEICSDHWKVSFAPGETCVMATIDNTHLGYYPEFSSPRLADWEGHDHVVVLTDSLALDVTRLQPQITVIDLVAKRIIGLATPITQRLLNQLRRCGVRFYYDAEGGRYVAWR